MGLRDDIDRSYYLGVFVAFIHAFITLALGDDLPCVFDDNLIWLEGAVGSYAVATISRLHDLDANIVFASRFTSLL